MRAEAGTVEQIVAEDECDFLVADELCADRECLCETIRGELLREGERDPELGPVTEQSGEMCGVVGRRDDEDVADARQHER
ncbi:hypothetical protein D9M70_590960 [compost metagenome]